MSLADKSKAEAAQTSSRDRFRLKTIACVVFGIGLIVLLGECSRVLFGANFHTVIPGRVYRCAQPSPQDLHGYVQSHGIRTVINLRGCCSMQEWYQEQAETTSDLSICQEDLNFSAGRLPSATELKHLLQVLEHVEYPILIHCRRGSDRTGMVAAIIMLLQEGVSYDEALGELHLRFGHLAVGRTVHMDSFFTLYREWLEQGNGEHSPQRFRQWVVHEYRGGPCQYRFEGVEIPQQPIPVKQPLAIRIKLRNTSAETWHFSPLENAGVHVNYVLYDGKGRCVAAERAGMFRKDVPPGERVDLVVPVNPVAQPGRYRLVLTMSEEQMGGFVQMGSEPFETRLEFRE
jgi:protein tyrosine phosphatase (PTP) superfamily phosphohydrolase (DUF442 family)